MAISFHFNNTNQKLSFIIDAGKFSLNQIQHIFFSFYVIIPRYIFIKKRFVCMLIVDFKTRKKHYALNTNYENPFQHIQTIFTNSQRLIR